MASKASRSRWFSRQHASGTPDRGLTSNTGVKLSVAALMALAAVGTKIELAQVQPNEPTKQEIAEAHRSKSGEGGTFIPSVRWERRRIKEIRGWKLHFKRISQKQSRGGRATHLPVAFQQ